MSYQSLTPFYTNHIRVQRLVTHTVDSKKSILWQCEEPGMPEMYDLVVGSEPAMRVLEGTADHWRGNLTVEQWKDRHETMRARFEDAGQETRVFALFGDDGQEYLASCDVWKRPAVIKDNNTAKLRYINDYVLSSVFANPKHRRKGLAETLIKGVVKTMRTEDPEGIVTLWSDVGEYYARCGFKLPQEPNSCKSIIMKPTAEAPWPVGVEQLTRAQALDLVDEYKRLVLNYLDKPSSTPRVAILPGRMPFDHFMLRGEVSAEAVGIRDPIEVYGARTQNQHGWAVWSTDFNSNHIYILAIVGSADEIADLCAAASAAAATEKGLFEVEMYPTSLIDVDVDEALAALKARGIPAKLVPREGSWPMSLGPTDNVEWVHTGKYAWF